MARTTAEVKRSWGRGPVKPRRSWVAAILAGALLWAAGAYGPIGYRSSDGADSSVAASIDPLSPAGGARSIEQTIAALQARVRGNPDDLNATAQLGLAYLQKGRLSLDPSYLSKAGPLFRSILQNDGSNARAMIGLGLLANAQHRFSAGLAWGRRATEAAPYTAAARGIVVDSLLELGRYRVAAAELQRMVDLLPDLASFSRVSYMRELRGDVPGAIAGMRSALQTTPRFGDDAAWVRSQIGDLAFSVGNIASAERSYRRAAGIAPDYYVPQVGLARVAAARGHLIRAIAMMERVTNVYPSPQNAIFLSELFLAAGRRNDARNAYRLVDAQNRLFAASGVVPDVEMTLFYANRRSDPSRTVALARRQYRDRPSIRTADALGWALHAAGRDEAAVRYSREALRLGTRDALYLFHAGVIALGSGDRAGARDLLRDSLATNPYFSVLYAPEARRLLAGVPR